MSVTIWLEPVTREDIAALTGESLGKCENPACKRQVSASSQYCCTACSHGHEMTYEVEPYREGEHWMNVHSKPCEDRHAQRGPVAE